MTNAFHHTYKFGQEHPITWCHNDLLVVNLTVEVILFCNFELQIKDFHGSLSITNCCTP